MNTIFLTLLIFFVCMTQKYSIFLINDDVLIDQILSGRVSGNPSSTVPFISILLGKILYLFYKFAGDTTSLFGILLISVNLLIILVIINLTFFLKNKVYYLVGISIILLIIPTTLISPTFTITAFLAQGIGLISLIVYNINNGKNLYFYFSNVFLITIGFLIRPETFFGILLFLSPILLIIIIKLKRFIIIIKLAAYFLFLNFIELLMRNSFIQNSDLIKDYLNFVDLRGSLSFTPALLKLHQLIISGEIQNSPFSNVDFILLQKWHVFDENIFNYENLNFIIMNVKNLIGIQGILNVDIMNVINRFNSEGSNFYQFLILTLILVLAINLKNKNFLINGFLFLVTVFTYMFGFYYLASVARLPYRTIFPLAILLIFTTYLFNQKNINSRNLNFFIVLTFVLSIFNINFHLKDEFGLSKILARNKQSLTYFKNRDDLLVKNLEKNEILISPIDNLPLSIQGTISRNISWKSSRNLISVDWSVNSPSWKSKVNKLGLDQENLYNSLARSKNVYYAGDSKTAKILDFYMNDHGILRGKFCKIKVIDNLEIFTYQASENVC